MKKYALLLFGFFLSYGLFCQSATYTDYINEASLDINHFRAERRFGLRTQMGGALGEISLHLDINYEPSESVYAGIGKGPGYESFGVFLKHYFEPNDLTLFNTFGYSRWYNSSNTPYNSSSGILQRALSESQKQSHFFNLDFLVVGFGLQYSPQKSDYLGFSYFLEANLMYEYKASKTIPTGGVGIAYNF